MRNNINILISTLADSVSDIPKFIGLEVLAQIVILGTYFAINQKWQLYNSLHLLGRARTIIALVPATFLAVPFGMITIYEGIGAFFITFLLIWILTTEIAIRGIIALIASFITGGAAHFICSEISPNNSIVTVGIPGLLGFLTLIGTSHLIAKSSWLGVRCPHCTTRGTVNSVQVGKDFLGTTTEIINNRRVVYNQYFITEENKCSHCMHTWRSTRETKETS